MSPLFGRAPRRYQFTSHYVATMPAKNRTFRWMLSFGFILAAAGCPGQRDDSVNSPDSPPRTASEIEADSLAAREAAIVAAIPGDVVECPDDTLDRTVAPGGTAEITAGKVTFPNGASGKVTLKRLRNTKHREIRILTELPTMMIVELKATGCRKSASKGWRIYYHNGSRWQPLLAPSDMVIDGEIIVRGTFDPDTFTALPPDKRANPPRFALGSD